VRHQRTALYKHFPNKQAVLARCWSTSASSSSTAAVRSSTPGRAARRPRALVDFHTDFALAEPDVIRVQDRDLASLDDPDRSVVRRLQRTYVELWTDVVCRVDPALPREAARLRAHAVFGLLNSTPHSAAARAARRRGSCRAMALRALVG
jgi:AcrR family transcriptional regulator